VAVSSCILFHGPGARQAALDKARDVGQLAAPPFGDGGLKADEAREAVSTLLNGSISFLVQVVVVGPMDEATPQASDVLLKRVEEFRGDIVQPILWANDLGEVTPTIRSRCIDYWSPATGEEVDDDGIMSAAWELVNLTRAKEGAPIPELVKRYSKELHQLLNALAEVLASDMDKPDALFLWEKLRLATLWKNPRPAEVTAALLEVACA